MSTAGWLSIALRAGSVPTVPLMPLSTLLDRRFAALRAQLDGLGLSRGELVALAMLVLGAGVLGGLLWFRPAAVDGTPAMTPGGSGTEPALALLPASPSPSPSPGSQGSQSVVVHVRGRVATPGLVELPSGSRVGDALAAAGGPGPDAAPEALNLARVLVDGEQLHVPAVGETPPPQPAATAAEGLAGVRGGAALLPDGRLDLNAATVEELEELPGVGPVTAERIVEHREEIGGFTDVGQLRDVPGIGEVKFQGLVEAAGV
jgi:competence protein ComEA